MFPADQLNTLRYGQQFPVGLYVATVLADMDFETYSAAGHVWVEDGEKWIGPPGAPKGKKGLEVVGVRVYTEHPSFEVLSFKYDLKDGNGAHYWDPSLPPPVALFDHLARGLLVEAWNVGFECDVWAACVRLYGWPALPYLQVRCAAAKSKAYSRPGALQKAAEVTGTMQKNAEGDRLIKKFTMPQKPTKKNPAIRIYPHDDPADFAIFVDYNGVDIEAEAHNSINTPDLSPIELEYWQCDQTINRRGVHVDIVTLRAAIHIIEQAQAMYGDEMVRLTGGIKPTELQQLRGWCAALGFKTDSLDEEHVSAALERTDLHPTVRRVLEIRALIGSASVKKVFAMVNQRSEISGRLHWLFNFHATRTGRPTGYGPQPTNLPKAGPNVYRCGCCGHYYGELIARCPWCFAGPEFRSGQDGTIRANAKSLEWNPDAMIDAIMILRSGDFNTVRHFYGDAMLALAGCLRGLFVAAPGMRLLSSDYTAIEAVVLACMAGEQWRIDLFRAKGKIYEKSGALVCGISYDEVLAHKERTGQHHPARQVGKTAELGLGYQGWINAWLQFDDSGTFSDDEIKKTILAWRDASPAIVEYWGGQSRRVPDGFGRTTLRWELFGVEGMFISAVLNPGRWYTYGALHFLAHGTTVTIQLPSGRKLTYHDVQLHTSDKYGTEYAISFWGWNTNPNNGPVNRWINMYTWGGRLVENITQAVSNDILRFASVNLEHDGYGVVLHVYDEIVCEVPENFGSVEHLETVMGTLPEWAKTPDGQPWPISAAGGWSGERYRKG